MSLLNITNLSFTYEGAYAPVFEGLTLKLDTSWKLGLVGRNGRGKTTLLRLLAGELDSGKAISLTQPCVRWPRPVERPQRPAMEILLEGIKPEEAWRLSWELSKLGLDEERLRRPFATLSGGEQTRALLAALFLNEDAYPMIDEPTNHLDGPGQALAANYLRSLDWGFLLVSHDRAFLDGCVDHILALNQTGPELVRWNFSVWFQEKQARDRRETAQNEKLRGEIRRLEQAARRTSRWSDQVERSKYHSASSGLKVDRGFVGHKSAKLMQRAKSLESRQLRAAEEKSALLRDIERADSLKLFPLTYHSERLVEVREFSPAYEGTNTARRISFTLKRGQRLCLDGGNGCGKSSLLRQIAGETVPHTGAVSLASGLEISYVPQGAEHLSGSPMAWAEDQGVDMTQFCTILRKLDFSRALLEGDMARYSAGQRKKVLLAASLCHSAHLYLWDEPLNYIDLFSRIQLEELILQYRPTMLLVEHDSLFRRRVGTDVVTM